MILTNVRPTLVDISPFFLPVPQHHDLDESFVQACHQTRRDLPDELTEALNQFAAGDSSGALLLRGLPVGVVPSTPATPSAPTAKDRTSECTLLTLATLLGQPVGYAPEHGGKIVQNIVPVQATAAKQVSTSSNVTLDFHTETAFHPEKPHYLLLLCLRSDPNAATLLCSVTSALSLLDAETISVLRQPRFRTRPDVSFLSGPDALGEFGPAAPILAGTVEHPTFTFDADLMIGLDDAAEQAIEALRKAVQAAHSSVVLEAGDLLVIDNHAAVHGRSPFAARYDGTDRWVQRAFVVDAIPEGSGRVITTTFPEVPRG